MTHDLSKLYAATGEAKLADLPTYLEVVREATPPGDEVVLTGQAPIWLYLAVAHALHGIATSLAYSSPVTGEVPIFNHNPHN